ncbi:carbonic anhydrase [Spirochaetia bacterium]|nr:carbonic anhydrase [Spirochaetia bacterium]GHU33251.1 carbonic anhydrase [Spirochaetia bacterium]
MLHNKKGLMGAVLAIGLMCVACTSKGHWGYEGEGAPENWVRLGFAEAGQSQSPINIDIKTLAQDNTVKKPVFQYKATAFEIENNGHTIELVPAEGADNKIFLDGKEYILQQLHFHAKSEHTVNGRYSPMEVHFVHKAADGDTAVVGFLINAGTKSTFFEEAFSKLPASVTKEELEKTINFTPFFARSPTFYRYTGSLTTPPCTEGIKWSVAATPVTLSADQIAAFTAIYHNNFRPIQDLNGRNIVNAR